VSETFTDDQIAEIRRVAIEVAAGALEDLPEPDGLGEVHEAVEKLDTLRQAVDELRRGVAQLTDDLQDAAADGAGGITPSDTFDAHLEQTDVLVRLAL
jgi:hypothetical protein